MTTHHIAQVTASAETKFKIVGTLDVPDVTAVSVETFVGARLFRRSTVAVSRDHTVTWTSPPLPRGSRISIAHRQSVVGIVHIG